MTDDPSRKRSAADAFGAGADGYLASDVHRRGADLDRIASWCVDATRALDVATGAGHTAAAIADAGVPNVVALDASPSMVETTTDAVPGVVGVVGDAERLPFRSGAFDCVACRIAAHHFPDPESFVAEVARVLRPGATLAFEDNVAPEDAALAAFLDRLERARDPTHVRSHTASTWRRWLTDAGFSIVETDRIVRRLAFDAWVDRVGPDSREARDAIARMLIEAPPAVAEAFDVRADRGRVESFGSPKVLIRAVRNG